MNNKLIGSELNNLIPPEIKNDAFYSAIQRLAREEDIQTVLEIGSSSGSGSTEAFVSGLRDNPNKPTLFCMEVSKTRFAELKKAYNNDAFVKCYNLSSVSSKQFPSQQEVIEFYNNISTNLNCYPLESILGWLEQDIEYVKSSGIDDNGIKKIKQENNIEVFDLVLIDGSEFSGSAELEELYGAKYICLDDINAFKNYQNHQKLMNDENYVLIDYNLKLRNGYSIFKKTTVKSLKYKSIQAAVESVEGFMITGQEEYLFNKVKSLPEDAVIVEIGSFKGRSTVAMGYACVGTKRKIYCIDTWDGNDSDFSERNFFEIWQENVKKNNLEDYVIPLRGYSHEILKQWDELGNNKAIDFIFIDGSHQYLDVLKDFELSFPLVKDGGWVAFHDVIHTWPGCERVWHQIAKQRLSNHEYSTTLACGQKDINAIPANVNPSIPIHFFTIVLNGQPFIRYHIDVLRQLPFKWHWHIVEGVAELNHDTAWSVQLGGRVSDEIHRNGHSSDGTTEYLDELAQKYPDNITIYRKSEGIFWDGKREMVNAPLTNIQQECLLWQIDVDELWTEEQICNARQMFIRNPDKTAAFYWCWYFVGEKLVISTRNCYAQNPQQEWLRTWKYKPGAFWAAHEPPVLVEALPNGQLKNLAAENPFLHNETEELGLVFQHFAYVTSEQLKFKELYYGYKNAVLQWNALQEQAKFPVFLGEYFSWVGDGTQVDTASSCGIVAVAQKESNTNDWRFLQPDEVQQQLAQIEKPKPIIIVDGVFFQLYQTGIARVWKSLLEEWSKDGFSKHIIVLDRADTAPKIHGIKYRVIPAYSYSNTEADKQMLQEVCDEEGADVFISTYYTTPLTTPSVFMAYDMIPEVFGWDLRNPMWREKHYGIQYASSYITISENTADDLVKCFANIPLESVTVAHCGVAKNFTPAKHEDINAFKTKYGIAKPYFIAVGANGGYKNSILFFQAFSKLASSCGFDIVCTGSGGLLAPEYRSYTLGSTVHMLQLNDKELAIAYSGAIALVYPSKYEGFGLPIVEAMACACPVITCPTGSIPEVGGEAVIYVKEDGVEELADALCEVQKPSVRDYLVEAGFEKLKQFSWSDMAQKVSSVLIETTLKSLNLKEINLIIFPDWLQSEELLVSEFERVIGTLATHPESQYMTLIIDTSNSVDNYAEFLLSAVSMNLLMQEDLDISEGMEISFAPKLSALQWQALALRLQARIPLEYEDKDALTLATVENLPILDFQENSFFLT